MNHSAERWTPGILALFGNITLAVITAWLSTKTLFAQIEAPSWAEVKQLIGVQHLEEKRGWLARVKSARVGMAGPVVS